MQLEESGPTPAIFTFFFCVPATSILYFKYSVHMHTAISGVYHLPHTPGEHAWNNVKLSGLNGACFMHFAYCKSIQGFTKTLGLLQKSVENTGFSSVLCESAHVGNHHTYNKKDFSRDCGNSRQDLPCTEIWCRDGLPDSLTGNQMILRCISGLFESWILSWGIVSAVIANFLLERFMIK